MHKSSQPQLAADPLSGQVAPTVIGPEKDRTELYLALGVLAILGLGTSAYWLSSRSGESEPTRITAGTSDLSFGGPVQPAKAEAKSIPMATAPIRLNTEPAAVDQTIKHLDLYFEVGRKGLTDEAKAQLLVHADLLKKDGNWGVVLQGYTDQQGSVEYNRKLGLRRAESVKEHLVGIGVPDHLIKVVSLGKDGALCADTSDTCSRMNRRVHLEFRNVGAEHLVPPVGMIDHTFAKDSSTESSATTSSSTESTPSVAIETTGQPIPPSPADQADVEK